MATFKHISSKNADYGAAEQYLTFEHDEFTMKPTLDESGRLMLREDYRIATLNCGGEDFAVACMRSNLRYGKNQKREDVKSHHYIISFDPRDAVDNGLTVDRAQALGEEFCRKQFPGHQAIVCTHPDGHNHSGNIHVHIVINSLRIAEVPFLPYMDRPADTRAGCKHRCTDAAMEYFKAEVMELCHRENLYQIDLLHGSKNRITEREYWAQRKGQAKLDKEAAALPAGEQPAKPTKFETDKEKLRQTIRAALSSAASYDEFAAVLLQQGVTVKESRGRLSYLTPDRTKPITARKLGDDFDRTAVLALLEQNAHRAAKQTAAVPEYPRSIRERLQGKKAVQTTPKKDGIQRMVDRATKRAEGKGVGYDRWAAKHNLKQMAATVTAYQQYGFSSPEELDEACSAAYTAMQESLAELKQVEKTLNGKKELQRQVLAYSKTRPVRDGLKQQKNAKAKAAYRQKHESDFIIADAAARYFRENGISKLPSYKSLQAEIESLIKEKNSGYNDYRAKREEYRRLQTVKGNIDQILRRERKPVKRQEQER
ncbi:MULTISPECIES: relaxase/mobilization nuclease domain-containing protein [Clostridia]|uniref:Relaxase/mobilization nuclease domain-containing protein n=3 Tax=Clostridia TaxID=186801 RepID=A0A6N7WLQ6_9FIRM|nr:MULTISPECIES: relaxase/mobilization nuclease domain-containing protein [Clostridia]MBN3013010.1 relaxase/mobilization nuclease domain-containing protein [Ruthenibacterium lactatiformans]MSS91437.1 relaxase/mobilization nuclease domain-containing protein [Eisenbergiella porci]